MIRCILSFLFLIFFFFAQAQTGGVKGTIRDETGKPIEYATIFVVETGSGTVSGQGGSYEVKLQPGLYTIVYQYLGYRTESRQTRIGPDMILQDISLVNQTLTLSTVDVYEGREDPAYTVMRKAIAKADYHRQQIDHYEAEVYLKGSGRLKKYPKILKKTMKEEGIDTSIAYVTESVSKVEYTRPNTFKETVISVRTQGEENATSPAPFIQGSFYHSEIAGAVSPLSTRAFGYYKFEFEGFFMDRGYGVNKIKVIPRSRGENVFEGYLYIVENQWNIYSLDLATYKLGIKFQVEQVYAPIDDKAWLPVTHKFNVTGKVFGFDFEYNYLAAAGKYKVEINPDLPAEIPLIDEKIDKAAAEAAANATVDKNASIKEKLSGGKEITRKELRQVMKEYEKEEIKETPDPGIIGSSEYKIDSNAYKRDSSYWEVIRPVPLTAREIKGYRHVDSIAVAEKAPLRDSTGAKVGANTNKKYNPLDIVTGHRYKVGKEQYIRHESFLQNLHFNPAEGFNLHTEITYFNSGEKPLHIFLTPRYSFGAQRLNAMGGFSKTQTSKDKTSRTTFSASAGRYVFQYNASNPLDWHMNDYLNLVEERNYLRIYEKTFAQARWSKTFSPKFNGFVNVEWSNRTTMPNITTQTWFHRETRFYGSNIPDNAEVQTPLVADDSKNMVLQLGISTRPWLKYRMRNNRKEPVNGSSPRLSLTYRKGISDILGSQSRFDALDFAIKHYFKIGVRGLIDFKVNAGGFLNADQVGFADFKHFDGNRTVFVRTDPVGSFRLLDYYRHSTKEEYLSTHVHYQFRKLLFTHIPKVWLTGAKENVFVNYLSTPSSKNYVEVGYSLDNILRVFRAELAFSFQNGRYQDWGILIGVASNLDKGVFNVNFE